MAKAKMDLTGSTATGGEVRVEVVKQSTLAGGRRRKFTNIGRFARLALVQQALNDAIAEGVEVSVSPFYNGGRVSAVVILADVEIVRDPDGIITLRAINGTGGEA